MQINKVTDSFSVAPQILPDDVKELADRGFKSIICNRPDGEESGQPTYGEIESEAKKYGIKIVHLPIVGGQITNDDINILKDKIEDMPEPILAYCRSGTRSITVWSIAQQGQRNLDEVLQLASQAGYDLSGILR